MNHGYVIHSTETAPEGSREMLENIQKGSGFVPNLMRIMAESPATLKAYLGLSGALHGSKLTATEREIVILTVSEVNNCEYCLAAHSTISLKMRVPQEIVDALRERRPLADAKLQALREFARDMTSQAGRLAPERIEALFAAGYSREQLLEAVTCVTLMTLTNYINHIVEPTIDEVFLPQAWPACHCGG